MDYRVNIQHAFDKRPDSFFAKDTAQYKRNVDKYSPPFPPVSKILNAFPSHSSIHDPRTHLMRVCQTVAGWKPYKPITTHRGIMIAPQYSFLTQEGSQNAEQGNNRTLMKRGERCKKHMCTVKIKFSLITQRFHYVSLHTHVLTHTHTHTSSACLLLKSLGSRLQI